MKISLLLLIFNVGLFFNLAAQVEYTPFDFEGSVWKESSFLHWYSKSYYTFEAEGDTIINGTEYYKLRQMGKEYIYADPFQYEYEIIDSLEIDHYAGSIRENAQKQIEHIKPGSTTPKILYDFNFNIGDTINVEDFLGTLKAEVLWIETIEICGIIRNSYFLNFIDYPPLTGHLVEGIGSLAGLFPEHGYYESAKIFECYSNQNCNCNEIIVGIEEENKKAQEIKVFPNPTIDEKIVLIQEGNVEAFNLQVYNDIGLLIYSTHGNAKETNIDCSGWPNGVYFLNFNFGETQINKKVIVR